MGFISRGSSNFLLLLLLVVVAIAMANNIWPPSPWGTAPPGLGCWCPCTCSGTVPEARTIVVGNTSQWNFGVNYTEWIMKNWPFYVGDTLVFMYGNHHSVYLMKDLQSFFNCSLEGSTMIGSTSEGGGEGFKVTLQPTPFYMPYLFACGEKQGLHCDVGKMKLAVWPLPRLRKN